MAISEFRAVELVEADVAAGTVVADIDSDAVDPCRIRAGEQELGLHRAERGITVERGKQRREPAGSDLDVVVEQGDRGCAQFERSVEAGVGTATETEVVGRPDNVDITVGGCTTTIVDQDHVLRITPRQGRCDAGVEHLRCGGERDDDDGDHPAIRSHDDFTSV